VVLLLCDNQQYVVVVDIDLLTINNKLINIDHAAGGVLGIRY